MDLRPAPHTARVPGRVFSFYFDFEDAAASLSVVSTCSSRTLHVLWTLQCACSGLVCCCRSRSWALTLGWSGGAKPVPSGMDWLGACPGGGTT